MSLMERSTARRLAIAQQDALLIILEKSRRDQNMTYGDLASRAGLARSTVHQLLTGYRKSPPFTAVVAVAHALGYDLIIVRTVA